MTFLELCQDMAREAGISGGVTSVVSQQGEAQRVVNWVAKAYRYIQNLHPDWKFLRRDVSFTTSVNAAEYTATAAGVPAGEFGEWSFVSQWRCYGVDAGVGDEQPVYFVEYDKFRHTYGYGNQRLQTGRPQVVTVAPDQSLIFWPKPDAEYVIVAEQHRAPHRLVTNDDAPIFAARFHNAIVYRALMLYGQFEGDATVMAVGQTEFQRDLAPMENFYLPSMGICNRPLA